MKKHRPVLLAALTITLITSAPAAVVLTNLTSPISTSTLLKGTGGFIPAPFSGGFEFTVAGGDHILTGISLSIGTHGGSVPLTVDLFSSPSGPDTAVFLTTLTGPSQPSNQVATYAPSTSLTLQGGNTYFLSLSVNGSASTYSLNRTDPSATGTWDIGNFFTRTGSNSWGSGSSATEVLMEIAATPLPEPSTAILGGVGFILLLRRRR